MEKSKNIHIGHCTQPHGIRGEFLFIFYNNESRNIQKNSEILIIPRSAKSSLGNELLKIAILDIKYGNKVIARLEGIETRNQVESMIPFDIYYPREKLPKLGANEFYLNDLLGSMVLLFSTKEEIGVIESFYENGEQVVLQIKTATEKIDILFLEQFIPIVDIEKNIIEVILPEMIE